MGSHYQPWTVGLLCSSIMTSRCCTCFTAWPCLRSGQAKISHVLSFRLTLLPHAALLCTAPHLHSSLKPLIWSKLGATASLASSYTCSHTSSSHPLYRNMMVLQWCRGNKQRSIGTRKVAIKHDPLGFQRLCLSALNYL